MNEKFDFDHHKQHEYCRTRLKYRASKSLTAVKVYTVANESKHIVVFGVPRINLGNELKNLLAKYGQIKSIEKITETFVKQSNELFTDCFHCEFEKLEHARRAKKFCDTKNFYGGILHVSYGPEYESMDDLREKLSKRISEVKYRINLNKKTKIELSRKRVATSEEENNIESNVKLKKQL